jgi:hypothetical protein
MEVTIGQTNLTVLEWIQARCGGKIAEHQGKGRMSLRHKQMWYWYLQKRATMLTFLERIAPYVRVKKSQVDLALHILRMRPNHQDPALRASQYEQMRRLNHRGRMPFALVSTKTL